VAASVRRTALLAMATIAVTASHPAASARAVELRDVSGWWIAIDETFPKHWKSGAIAPMEEVLQINPDGRVSDRVLLTALVMRLPFPALPWRPGRHDPVVMAQNLANDE